MSLRVRLAATLAACTAFTTLVVFTAVVDPGAFNPPLHVAVETAGSLIAVLAALLMYGRFGRSLLRSDLVLSAALAVFAAANFLFAGVPSLIPDGPEEPYAWASLVARTGGAALMAAAAFMPAHTVRRPAQAARRWLGGCALALALIGVAVVVAGPALPAPLPPGAAPGEAFAASHAVAAIEAVVMVLLGAAAVGFAGRAVADGDALIGWFATAAVFGAFARLHYVIYPSVLTDWFAAGDVLRLAFFLCLLVGGGAELRLAQRALTAQAVADERRRIARDLHDGTAQDLAFIVQVGRRMIERGPTQSELEHLVRAAGHALDNTRNVVADLFRPSDEPLTAALRRAAEEVAGREGVHAEVTGAADLQVPPATREALCHLVREAVTNAIRHGGARSVEVRLEEGPELRLTIGDDGRGFDVGAVQAVAGQFGLLGMGQRVALLGGELEVASEPGAGTEVLVRLP